MKIFCVLFRALILFMLQVVWQVLLNRGSRLPLGIKVRFPGSFHFMGPVESIWGWIDMKLGRGIEVPLSK